MVQVIKFSKLKDLDPNKNYLIQFSTKWCGDCKMMKPVIDNLENWAKENNKEITIIEVDAEEANLYRNKDSEWDAYKVPSFYIVNKGKKKHIGYEYLPIDLFKEEIDKLD